ncbi:MAG: adenylate/guanylate cyclase domain-containing protein [Chloroflexota bacterium]
MASADRPVERRLITSLFLDIVGSTELMMRLPGERLKRTLDEAFAQLSEVIGAHGGTVEKYIGDAVFAVFGVPTAHADDPIRALRAADACAHWAEEQQGATVPLAVRIGVETGPVVVDVSAAETDRERMIVGPSVNLAARLQAAADPGHTLVGPTCHEATASHADFESVGELQLKGIGVVPAWRLVGVLAASRLADPPFIGRSAAIEQLRGVFDQARAGRASLALIIAPPGQGKSRLAREFVAQLEDVEVRTARCRPGAEQGALTPLKQLLSSEGTGAVESSDVLERLTALFPRDEERDRIAAALIHSAGLPGAPQPLPANPIELQDELVNGWRRYFAVLGRERPVVVWIEDLHWAEPQLLRLVDRLTSGNEARLLLLGTARPELTGSIALRPAPERLLLELPPLDAAAAQELAGKVGTPSAEAIERAAGNPLFIVELARSRLAPTGEIPTTLHAAIAARIDELPRADREFLQRASVAGETFTLRDAALLADADPGEVSGALARLSHGGYLIQVERAHRFYHPLVHDVAYSRLSLPERMWLHARFAQDGVDAEDVEALAHHWWEAVGGTDAEWVWENRIELERLRRVAFATLLAAGRRHSARFAQERAVEVLERAVELAAAPEQAAEAERELGLAYARNALGDAAWEHRMRAISMYREAGVVPPATLYADTAAIPVFNYAFTRSLPEESVVLRLLAEGMQAAQSSRDDASLARLLVLDGYYNDNPARAAEALEIVEAAEDPLPFTDFFARLAIVQMFLGEISKAGATYERVEALILAGGQTDEAEYLAYRPTVELLLGRPEQADALAQRFLQLTAGMGPHMRTHGLQAASSVALIKGDWRRLLEIGHEVANIVEANPETPYCIRGAMAASQGAVAAAMLGDREDAEKLITLTERMLKPGLQRSYALFLPSAMLGRSVDPSECVPAADGIVRPWQRQIPDPAYQNLAIGILITGHREWPSDIQEHLKFFANHGSPVAGALAEVGEARRAALKTLEYAGLSALLDYSP